MNTEKSEKLIFLNYVILQNNEKKGKCILRILHHLLCLDMPFINQLIAHP